MLLLAAADPLCGSARRLERMKHAPPGRRLGGGRCALRRPLRHEPRPAQARTPPSISARALEDAIRAPDRGELEVAVEATAQMLVHGPLDADAHFTRGLAELGLGDAQAAAASLRRALYVDPQFGLAAFQLGRALEACEERAAAARAYGQGLNTLNGESNERHAAILERVDVGDIAAACVMRRSALTRTPTALSGVGGRR
jgi:tetratricopeptide (TPR) repeat protein